MGLFSKNARGASKRVMAGLDPAIHLPSEKPLLSMDARVEPAHDDGWVGSANPVDSCPILIRLDAIPNIKELVIKTSLVRDRQTRSSALESGLPRHVA
jgi:hypothetical protein